MQYSTLAIKWDTFLFAKQDSIHRPTFVKKMCDKLGFVKVSGTPPHPPGGFGTKSNFDPKCFACGALFEVFLPV